MWKSVFKVAAATVLFAGVHSLLATRAAKRRAAEVAGERARNVLYRPLYNAQAVATFGALVIYCLKQPDREIYSARGPLAWAMRVGQLGSLVYLLWAAKQVGFLNFSGASNLLAALDRSRPVLSEPEAQGPALDATGRIKATGPFGTMRHPLNLSMLPLIWLMPRMTVNLLAFNLVTTAYLLAGSLHEEHRLRATYGEAYLDYQRRVPFFPIPVERRLLGE